MAGGRQLLDRNSTDRNKTDRNATDRNTIEGTRRWIAVLLILAAAAWIARSLEAQRREPSPWLDDQALLTRLARLAEPVEQLVPEGEALRYVEPLDERGQPLARDNALCYWHALLAPRRLGHAIDSRYLLVRHGNPANPRPLPGLESARLLAELGEGFQLVEKRP